MWDYTRNIVIVLIPIFLFFSYAPRKNVMMLFKIIKFILFHVKLRVLIKLRHIKWYDENNIIKKSPTLTHQFLLCLISKICFFFLSFNFFFLKNVSWLYFTVLIFTENYETFWHRNEDVEINANKAFLFMREGPLCIALIGLLTWASLWAGLFYFVHSKQIKFSFHIKAFKVWSYLLDRLHQIK